MRGDCVFCRISRREIPANIIYEVGLLMEHDKKEEGGNVRKESQRNISISTFSLNNQFQEDSFI